MSFCTKCGTKISAGSRFCTKCGKAISASAPMPQSSGMMTQPSAPTPQSSATMTPQSSATMTPPSAPMTSSTPMTPPSTPMPPPRPPMPSAGHTQHGHAYGQPPVAKKKGSPAVIIAACVGALVLVGAGIFIALGIMAENAAKKADEHKNAAVRFAIAGDYQKAVGEFELAVEQMKKSNNDTLAAWLAQVLVLQGRAQMAGVTGVATILGEGWGEIALTRPETFTPQQTAALNRAIEIFTTAIAHNRQNAVAYRERGRAYNWKGENDLAINDFDNAIRIDPSYLFAYNSRGILHSSMRNDELAVADYTRVLEIDPTFAIALRNRAGVHTRNERFDLAVEDYEAALRIDPHHAGTLQNIEWARGELRRQERNRDQRLLGTWVGAHESGAGYAEIRFQRDGGVFITIGWDGPGVTDELAGRWRTRNDVITVTYDGGTTSTLTYAFSGNALFISGTFPVSRGASTIPWNGMFGKRS